MFLPNIDFCSLRRWSRQAGALFVCSKPPDGWRQFGWFPVPNKQDRSSSSHDFSTIVEKSHHCRSTSQPTVASTTIGTARLNASIVLAISSLMWLISTNKKVSRCIATSKKKCTGCRSNGADREGKNREHHRQRPADERERWLSQFSSTTKTPTLQLRHAYAARPLHVAARSSVRP